MRLILAIAAFLITSLSSVALANEGELINSFESKNDTTWLRANNTKLTLVDKQVTEGKQALRVDFNKAQWPNVTFAPKKAFDWSKPCRLALDVTNPGSEPVTFNIRVDDDMSADGVRHCRTGTAQVPSGKTQTFTMTISGSSSDLGMRGLPPSSVGIDMGGGSSESFNPSHIVAFQVFMSSPKTTTSLILDNIRLINDEPPKQIVDEFGQYTKAEWPGKLRSLSDFAKRKSSEEKELAARPYMSDRDQYGGWANGPKLKATGYFRTEKVNGKWWFVDPAGRLFFSMGVDCVGLDAVTITTGREQLFTWLPEASDDLYTHTGYVENVHSGPVTAGSVYNFYEANLHRKYGSSYHDKALDMAIKRLKSWGFNTLGNWTNSSLYRNNRLPYVASAGVGGDHTRISSGSDYWGKMHDPFDPQFILDTRNMASGLAAQVGGDPWCLGIFVDNELSWGQVGSEQSRYGLALSALGSTPLASPAKRVFLRELKEKYDNIERLNTAWETTFISWKELDSPVKPSKITQALHTDLANFTTTFAKRYFTVVKNELKKVLPNHLYLGCRFAWKTPETIQAAAEVCDVVSFNIYSRSLDPQEWTFVQSFDKPCIIGEFHFGALDRGMFHTGLVAAETQEERANMYIDYVNSVLDHPSFIGCHWFQYIDEPLTGRAFDGENYNIGWVDVTDTPYEEMVKAAQSVHSKAYQRR